jgi:hypothetical protein
VNIVLFHQLYGAIMKSNTKKYIGDNIFGIITVALLIGVIFFFCIPTNYGTFSENITKKYVQSFLQEHSTAYSITLDGESNDFEEVSFLIDIEGTGAVVRVSTHNVSVSSLDIGIDGSISTFYDSLNDFDIKILANAGVDVSKLKSGQNIHDYDNHAAVRKLIKYLFVEIEKAGFTPAPQEQDEYFH